MPYGDAPVHVMQNLHIFKIDYVDYVDESPQHYLAPFLYCNFLIVSNIVLYGTI